MRLVKEYLMIVIGCFIMAISLNGLLIPNKIAAGGVSGLATVLYYLFGIPVSITIVVINIPLFIAGVIYLGKKFGIKTLVGTYLLPLLIAFTEWTPVFTEDLLLATVFGGVLMGVGLGIIFRANGSTGGTALAGQLLNKFFGFTVGQSILIIDFLVIAFAGMVFNAELAMYALISVYVTGKVIDLTQQGFRVSKMAYIISNNPQEISEAILYKLNRGATSLKGKGVYTGEKRDILFCVVSQMEIAKLKEIVYEVDKKAFVVVSDVTEALGEGFSSLE
ncbi:Uncharacterized membrane-anchored protein YitT, contains DUF161 and DUF2179 domains [Anaerobranca californiensis DSM 14826]|uniref:Uncharacterized membrane-anchored protein YitT, contains DUF161 and DUF2179 domains n=1 Tax=Anaerobranca californiensis DSM 14826 TaxID=1120989 RepID=A0A1M6PCY4_9FIRM|nr:YitT family protein [Anaerobranca californiensis]SHK05799.1 Uncharacterized membrane-anchored protein YitT, contains DUF161 and DUF2179 domains [Anaerobranca californiensis DSM 14826]